MSLSGTFAVTQTESRFAMVMSGAVGSLAKAPVAQMRAVTLPVTGALRVSRRDSPLAGLYTDFREPRLGPVEFDPGLPVVALRLLQVLDRSCARLVEAANALQNPACTAHFVARLVVVGISLGKVGGIDHGERLAFRDVVPQPYLEVDYFPATGGRMLIVRAGSASMEAGRTSVRGPSFTTYLLDR